MVTEDQVREKLKTVMDPEMMINIVDLGLIYEVKVKASGEWERQSWQDEGEKVEIRMTLTSPGCPLAGTFEELVSSAVKQLAEVKVVDIELTFEPAWSTSLMSQEAKWELGFL